MIKNELKIYLAITLFSNIVFAQNIAFTFDDGPKVEKMAILSPSKRNELLLDALNKANVKAAIFVTAKYVQGDTLDLIKKWGESGHIIGNHTFNHLSMANDSIPIEVFKNDLLACDSVIRKISGYQKLYRFPYLKEGNTIERRDEFRAFLKDIRYKPAPVSIDASDWYYNLKVLNLQNSNSNADLMRYKVAYLNHLWNRANYYDSLSRIETNRSVNHILLIHHNTINALFLSDIIKMFKNKGWKIVSAKYAFQDPLYSIEPEVVPAGESIIWSIAKIKKFQGLRYPAEDERYERPILDSLGL